METLKELKTQKNKKQINNNYIDLSQYETIPALDRALAEPEGQIYTNYEDFRKDLYKDWYEEDD